MNLTEAELRAALRDELRDELAGITGIFHDEKTTVIADLDKLFFSKKIKIVDSTEGETQVLHKYWHNPNLFDPHDGYLEPPSPSTDYHFSMYTKNSWKYPWGGVYTILPTLPKTGGLWFFGFEPGPGGPWGLIGFVLGSDVEVSCDGRNAVITDYLPVDYDSADHLYTIKVNRSFVEYFIDFKLVAIGIKGAIGFTSITGPPYEILGSEKAGFIHATAFIEFHQSEVTRYDLDPQQFRAMGGDPVPPRSYRLYETGTNNLFAGKTVEAGTLVSHPFPILGFEGKTLHFRADQDSVANGLIIEYLTQADNWRTYDAVTYAADDDWFRTPTGEGVLARLSYEPAAYPAEVVEGEVALR